MPGTLELIPHESYRLMYEIDGQTVWVLALAHAVSTVTRIATNRYRSIDSIPYHHGQIGDGG
jgi:hypothetical protein